MNKNCIGLCEIQGERKAEPLVCRSAPEPLTLRQSPMKDMWRKFVTLQSEGREPAITGEEGRKPLKLS